MTSLWDSIPKETKRSRLPLLNEKLLGDRDYCTLLLGEANPYGGDPRYALYPEPEGSSGWRLCHMVMGLGARRRHGLGRERAERNFRFARMIEQLQKILEEHPE
jgi:hypothetical protein